MLTIKKSIVSSYSNNCCVSVLSQLSVVCLCFFVFFFVFLCLEGKYVFVCVFYFWFCVFEDKLQHIISRVFQQHQQSR